MPRQGHLDTEGWQDNEFCSRQTDYACMTSMYRLLGTSCILKTIIWGQKCDFIDEDRHSKKKSHENEMKDIGVSPETIKIQYERQKCKEANQMTKSKWEELGEGGDQYQRTQGY